MMNTRRDVEVFDRAIKIKGQENIDRFSSNPETFLRDVGALDGIEGFNGIRSESDGVIDDLSAYFSGRSFLKASGTIEFIIVHHGIPYEDYCTWHIQD